MCSLILTLSVLSLFTTYILANPSHENEFKKPVYDILKSKQLFDNFLRTHKKNYTEIEYERRHDIFLQNLKELNQLNEKIENAIYAINKFSDLTNDEFKTIHTCFQWSKNKNYTGFGMDLDNLPEDVPESFDWRDKGVVTSVKSQGQCGTCWAFSALASIESQYALHKGMGELIDLSEQDVFNCIDDSATCESGGYPDSAFEFIEKRGGVLAEQDDPYTAVKGSCKFNVNEAVKDIKVASHKLSLDVDEEILTKLLLKNGPLSIGINGDTMKHYHKGIDHPTEFDCDPGKLGHAVTLVGYGVDTKKKMKYWLIKNSWGEDWGEDGYYRVKRGSKTCGVSAYVSSVTLA